MSVSGTTESSVPWVSCGDARLEDAVDGRTVAKAGRRRTWFGGVGGRKSWWKGSRRTGRARRLGLTQNLSILIFSFKCRHLLIRKITQPPQNYNIAYTFQSTVEREIKKCTCHITKLKQFVITSTVLFNII